ncbi:MAG TPA: YciI family protein [Streptosporangiaceae bacterium]
MRYLLLIYSNPDNWEHPVFLQNPGFLALPAAERAALTEQAEALRREITESGELVAGVALADSATARTIRVRDGVPIATDGPYVETKEHLAGYVVLDCDTQERADEIAARIPDARFAAIEVRPITETAGRDG